MQRVTDIMGEIAAASAGAEPRHRAGEPRAVTQMDEVTQQNAALVEEAAAAARSLVKPGGEAASGGRGVPARRRGTHGATHGAVPAVRAAPVRAPAPKRVQPT